MQIIVGLRDIRNAIKPLKSLWRKDSVGSAKEMPNSPTLVYFFIFCLFFSSFDFAKPVFAFLYTILHQMDERNV
jgi:hypothetical protein